MSSFSRRTWITGVAGLSASISAPARANIRRFTVRTATFEITASVEYFDAVSTPSLTFQEILQSKRFCLSAKGVDDRNCIRNFVGSLALASYAVKPLDRIRPVCSSLTEAVRIIDKDSAVPDRAPFRRTIGLISGHATDIQVFGFEQSPHARDTMPSSDPAWCLVRQELFCDAATQPFLVIHWKQTLPAIRLLDVAPVGGTQILNDSHPLF